VGVRAASAQSVSDRHDHATQLAAELLREVRRY
jgi:hypothetical protein